MAKSVFSPTKDEITAVRNGYRAWREVNGLGPDYFACACVEEALFALLNAGRPAAAEIAQLLARGRARMVNFFRLIAEGKPVAFNPPAACAGEVAIFLQQLGEQAEIWRKGAFKALDFSRAEQEIFFLVVARSAPVLFNMGFADAVPHSAQVSRLTASMADRLGARHSEVLQAAIVGWLHDPKFHPAIDLSKQNLATHPVNASALAYCLFFDDAKIEAATLRYFHGNSGKHKAFRTGIVDALAINNDSRFVQMMVILPAFTRQVGEVYGPEVAEQFRAVIEGRLEAACKGTTPPALPDHLHGALAQVKLDSGLRGISRHGWCRALSEAGIASDDPFGLFDRLVEGQESGLAAEQIEAVRLALTKTCPAAILRADVKASTLLHHHQQVKQSGRAAAEALVVADPMMLSPHKVASVYTSAVIERLGSYVRSLDDNIRLLPPGAQTVGARWQRAVFLSMLDAADRLTGGNLMEAFKASHASTSVREDISDLRAAVLKAESWGAWAQACGEATAGVAVRQALEALEAAYVAVVNQYRNAVYQAASEQELDKFYPVR